MVDIKNYKNPKEDVVPERVNVMKFVRPAFFFAIIMGCLFAYNSTNVIIILPIADNFAALMLGDLYAFGGQITLWTGFLIMMVLIPLFTMLTEEEELMGLEG